MNTQAKLSAYPEILISKNISMTLIYPVAQKKPAFFSVGHSFLGILSWLEPF